MWFVKRRFNIFLYFQKSDIYIFAPKFKIMIRRLLLVFALVASFLVSNAKPLPGDGRGVLEGYRGFFDIGYAYGYRDDNLFGRALFTTSHGYQFCPYGFFGVGFGTAYLHNPGTVSVPVFAHLRSDLLNNSITPFVDVKVGYSFTDVEGLYFSPSLGCRFRVAKRVGLNLSLGYTLQKSSVYVLFWQVDTKIDAITFKFGIDF